MKAPEFCTNAAELMDDRAASRDTEGERSMARCVAAFNALYGHTLSETEGWQFMSLLKKARGSQGAFRRDDYEDDVAYCALAGESASATQDTELDAQIKHVQGMAYETPQKELNPMKVPYPPNWDQLS